MSTPLHACYIHTLSHARTYEYTPTHIPHPSAHARSSKPLPTSKRHGYMHIYEKFRLCPNVSSMHGGRWIDVLNIGWRENHPTCPIHPTSCPIAPRNIPYLSPNMSCPSSDVAPLSRYPITPHPNYRFPPAKCPIALRTSAQTCDMPPTDIWARAGQLGR